MTPQLPAKTTAAATAELPREFLTAREVEAIFGLRKSQVYQLARDGKLPVVRQGRAVRFSRQGIEAMHARAADVAELGGVDALDTNAEGLVARIADAVEAAARRGVVKGLQDVYAAAASAA